VRLRDAFQQIRDGQLHISDAEFLAREALAAVADKPNYNNITGTPGAAPKRGRANYVALNERLGHSAKKLLDEDKTDEDKTDE